MTTIDITRRAPFGAESIHRAVRAVESVLDGLRQRWAESETRDQLARLSPRQRADIGLADAGLCTLDLDEVARALSAGRR